MEYIVTCMAWSYFKCWTFKYFSLHCLTPSQLWSQKYGLFCFLIYDDKWWKIPLKSKRILKEPVEECKLLELIMGTLPYLNDTYNYSCVLSLICSLLIVKGSARNWTKYRQIYMEKSKKLVSPKIGTYGKNNSSFWPSIICKYLTYIYESTYFLGTFFYNGNCKN